MPTGKALSYENQPVPVQRAVPDRASRTGPGARPSPLARPATSAGAAAPIRRTPPGAPPAEPTPGRGTGAAVQRAPTGPAALPVRALAPARALTAPLPSAARPVHAPRPPVTTAVPLAPARGATAPVRPLAVQRLADPGVPRAASAPARRAPLPVPAPKARPDAAVLPVQRFSATPLVAPPTTTVTTTPTATPPPPPPPPPRSVQRAPEPRPRKTSTAQPTHTAHTRVPASAPDGGAFNPRSLTEFQLDELTHRLVGRITRQLRTEFRLDRERIGKLRDPRH
ncbi:extensin [Streptomyces vinaceus]|uniref:extensin n=1 Tax=Streptomyces vinaceus TaxID=1960 RepID=UPI00381E9231